MRHICLLVSVLLLALLALPALLSRRASADDPPAAPKKTADKKSDKPAKPADKTSDKDAGKRWAELLARREKISKAIDKLKADFEAADNEGKQKLRTTFEKLNAEFQSEVGPGLDQLAPVIHKMDPTDPIAAQIVIGKLLPGQRGEAVPDENYARITAIVKGLTRTDKESQATVETIIGILLENKRFEEVASIADKFVEAKDVNPRLLILDGMAHLYLSDFDQAAELAKRAVASANASPDLLAFQKSCDEYVEFWKTEQEIRAREAEADDLPRVVLKTSKGNIVLELFENEAPNTVANFISLVETRKYDGVDFHRFEHNFVIQGGSINPRGDDPENPDQGGPGYKIPCECYTAKARMHFQGSLSMAHAGKDTGGSQFFITHTPTPHLNWAPDKMQNNHTVFGRVVEGLDVALALRAGDKIKTAKVLRKREHAYVPEKVGDKPAARKSPKSGKTSASRKKPDDE